MEPPEPKPSVSGGDGNAGSSVERDQLNRRMDAVGRLAEGISHEFNNLLTSILGFAYLITDQSPEDDPRKNYAREIVQSGERAAELIRQMLEFSRKQSAHFERVRLHDLIRAHADSLRARVPESVALRVEFAARDDRLWADAEKIQEMVSQLVLNANDAMPEAGGTIRVASRTADVEEGAVKGVPAGSYFLLSIADDGEGMDSAVAEKIFDPFFSTRDVGKGTGLGLSIVYNHVEQHQGYITFSSVVGEGTTFDIYLPCDTVYDAPEPRDEGAIPEGNGETILLIDDDEAVRSATAQNLRRIGYAVLEAPGAERVLEQPGEELSRVDLVMMDLSMEVETREALIRALGARSPRVEVVYYSGYDRDSAMASQSVSAEGEGMVSTNFLHKPFRPHRLARVIRQALAPDG